MMIILFAKSPNISLFLIVSIIDESYSSKFYIFGQLPYPPFNKDQHTCRQRQPPIIQTSTTTIRQDSKKR